MLGESNSFLHPHEVFALVATEYPEQFRKRFGADRTRLSEFWAAFGQSDWGREVIAKHPHLRDRDLSRTVPIMVHLDTGPISRNKSMKLLQWGSLLSTGSECFLSHPCQTHERLSFQTRAE